jgi:hypothetical protein
MERITLHVFVWPVPKHSARLTTTILERDVQKTQRSV